MKKKRTRQNLYGSSMSKILLKMKLLSFFIWVSVITTIAGNSYSQQTKFNLSFRNVTVREVFQKIEDTSEFIFLYSEKSVDVDRRVDINVANQTVEAVLVQLFKGTKNYFEIKNRQISILEKGLTELPNSIQNEVEQQQQKSISGKVTDSSGIPMPGVTVLVKGTTNGTITDADGKYSLNKISESGTLVFSFVGMKTLEIIIAGKSNIDIKMEEETVGLDEVVAIGYGTMKKSDLTGSVASVSGSEISKKVSSISVSQALQGMSPGLMVTRSGGSDASESATIRVRGITSIGDSNPLIIIDGVPAATLDRVNPNDIESISVLKDAASAAIYGSRAAAGVIVVTTKKAKDGELKMSYDYNFTVEQPTRMAGYNDAVGFMKLFNERTWNDNNNINGGEYSTFSKDLIDNYYKLNTQDPNSYPNTDWHGLMLKNWAAKNRHMISLSGGTKNVRSYVSFNVDDAEGLYIGKKYDRYSIRANNDLTFNRFFSVNLNFNGLYSKDNEPQQSQAGNAIIPGQIMGQIYPAEWTDGRIAPGKGGENPYAVLKYAGSIENKSSLFGGKFQLNFTPVENLKFSAAYSAELYNLKGKSFRKKLTYTSFDDPSNDVGLIMNATTTRLQESRNDRLSHTLQFLANYIKSINKHDLQFMAGFEESSDFNESLGASRDEYALKNFPYLDLGNADYQFNSGNANEYANRSFFGRVIYGFDDKYLLQSNIRYDGSSRFNKDYRWGLFPSVSAGWVISKESFMKFMDKISFLKVRASWGSLGNERIGNYPYQSTLGFTSVLLYQGTSAISAQGAGVMDYAIPDITWETTNSYDFGADARLFDDKLTFTADYYKKTTRDMLLALEIPDFIGLNNPQQNTGKMFTKGWELSIGWNDHKGDFRYSITAHLSDSKSIMGDLGGTEFLGSQVKFKGSEFNEWYGFKSNGLYQTQEDVDNSAKLYSNLKPGDVKYIDISGPNGVPDGKISSEYDRTLLGGSLPRYLYGGDIEIGYKNFNLGIIFQGVGKLKSYIKDDWVDPYYEFPSLINGNSWSRYNTDEQNIKAKYPRLTSTNKSNNYATSDFWLFNGAYFRLKNISLSYNIPQKIVSKLKLSSVKVYANASDVFSIDSYPKGWDPETTSTYWINRAFTLGVSVNF